MEIEINRLNHLCFNMKFDSIIDVTVIHKAKEAER